MVSCSLSKAEMELKPETKMYTRGSYRFADCADIHWGTCLLLFVFNVFELVFTLLNKIYVFIISTLYLLFKYDN